MGMKILVKKKREKEKGKEEMPLAHFFFLSFLAPNPLERCAVISGESAYGALAKPKL